MSDYKRGQGSMDAAAQNPKADQRKEAPHTKDSDQSKTGQTHKSGDKASKVEERNDHTTQKGGKGR